MRSFRELASCGLICEGSEPGHGDGWGIVTWEGGKPVYLGREPRDAFTDPAFEAACGKGDSMKLSSPIIAHLRKASIGLKVRENTHPFVVGDWAFAHNGTIRRLKLRYTTDSQWFFESIISDYEENGKDLVSAITKNVKLVREVYPYSSMTFLMSNGKRFYAFRDAAENAEYYGMYFALTDMGIVLCQEKFCKESWQELENGSLLTVDCGNLSFEIQSILPELKPKAV